MAKFLNTSAINYFLEELIKNANERVILISPFLKLNDKIKELIEDKNRLKIDVRIIYGKSELQPEEIQWLNKLDYVRTSFCKNLHAKCYINENLCIITSLNLYEFSQINNNEMGILLNKKDDAELYKESYEEAQRIIRISEEVKISMQRIIEKNQKNENTKLTSSKLAKKLGINTKELLEKLTSNGYLEIKNEKHFITEKGKEIGGEYRSSPKFGSYFLWPDDFNF